MFMCRHASLCLYTHNQIEKEGNKMERFDSYTLATARRSKIALMQKVKKLLETCSVSTHNQGHMQVGTCYIKTVYLHDRPTKCWIMVKAFFVLHLRIDQRLKSVELSASGACVTCSCQFSDTACVESFANIIHSAANSHHVWHIYICLKYRIFRTIMSQNVLLFRFRFARVVRFLLLLIKCSITCWQSIQNVIQLKLFGKKVMFIKYLKHFIQFTVLLLIEVSKQNKVAKGQ